jgi:hypothetical protein
MTVEEYARESEEYADLIEEYLGCDDHDERCRCAARMSVIVEHQTRS